MALKDLAAYVGVKGPRNLAAWAVAGAAAYVLWVLPEQRDAARRKEIVEEWKNRYKENPGVFPHDAVRVKPDAAGSQEG